MSQNAKSPGSRTAPHAVRQPENNRKLLILAALDTVADHGITDTTVSRIIDRAGLSRGMIHLHFGGKDKLLAAAAETFNADYYAALDQAVQAAGADPVAVVRAVVRTDLGPVLLNARAVRIWHAFRGDPSGNPQIARYSDTRDLRLRKMLGGAFDAMADSEGAADPAQLSRDATYGTLIMLEGLWTDYLTHMDAFSREDGERIVFRFLSGLFPRTLPV